MWMPAPLTRSGSGSLPPWARFSSQNGSRPCTVGMTGKLNSCGGDGIDHSSVAPFHGSAGACTFGASVLITLR